MIYLDNNATTEIGKAVAEAMMPFIYEHFGNPSSSHDMGAAAKHAVEVARERVATSLDCSAAEIVFTGGYANASRTEYG